MIAEGVESEVQMRVLQKHGVDKPQGNLLGRPQPAAQLVHDNATTEPPLQPDVPASEFEGLPTVPAPL